MSDQPEQPEAPDGEAVTTSAGAKPPMFTPAHGRGRLFKGGVKGNAGGGRHPSQLVEQCVIVLGLTLDKLVERLEDPARRFTTDELRLILQAVAPYVLPSRIEHSGPAGGPIAVDNVSERLRQRLVARLHERQALRPPPSEPPTPPPEPRGVARAAL